MTKWLIIPPGTTVYMVEASSPGAAARKVDRAYREGEVTLYRQTPNDVGVVSANGLYTLTRHDLRPPREGGAR